ncbi:MAG: hypothetical protein P4M11_08970 [Candidatus Pacebacteria bacterium]|nr:hypothetical protein [Candidatus Paceibacterota bacterium]
MREIEEAKTYPIMQNTAFPCKLWLTGLVLLGLGLFLLIAVSIGKFDSVVQKSNQGYCYAEM